MLSMSWRRKLVMTESKCRALEPVLLEVSIALRRKLSKGDSVNAADSGLFGRGGDIYASRPYNLVLYVHKYSNTR